METLIVLTQRILYSNSLLQLLGVAAPMPYDLHMRYDLLVATMPYDLLLSTIAALFGRDVVVVHVVVQSSALAIMFALHEYLQQFLIVFGLGVYATYLWSYYATCGTSGTRPGKLFVAR
jgi:hypothetical protein